MFTFSERHVTVCHYNDHVTVYHYNDTRSTATRWSFDNDQRHVMAFRPISEAAHSWSYDKYLWKLNRMLLMTSLTFEPNRTAVEVIQIAKFNRIAIGICPSLRCHEPNSTGRQDSDYNSCINLWSIWQWYDCDTISQSINSSINQNKFLYSGLLTIATFMSVRCRLHLEV